ncbi:hypothetical protein Tco_1202198 [Tanacetum coccineum]
MNLKLHKRREKGIVTGGGDEESLNKAIPTLTVVYQDPDEPIRIPYKIYWKLYNITNDEIQDYLNKEEAIKKKVEQAREHSKKVKKAIKLRKKRLEKYMWTTSSRLRMNQSQMSRFTPTQKPKLLIVYRAYDRRNFQVHNPFKFSDFGVTELDELGLIIQKKKNKIVGKLMIALGKECNISLPDGVPIFNNMVIEEPKYGIFFIDVFGDECF